MKIPATIKIPEYLKANFDKYKYVLLICAVGLLLTVLPLSGSNGEAAAPPAMPAEDGAYDVAAFASGLEQSLSEIDGVGRVRIILTVKTGFEKVFAYDQSKNETGTTNQTGATNQSLQSELVTVTGGGQQSPVVRKMNYPVFMGAVIICDGGDSPRIQLELTQAIKSLTGISSDSIVITKMKN